MVLISGGDTVDFLPDGGEDYRVCPGTRTDRRHGDRVANPAEPKAPGCSSRAAYPCDQGIRREYGDRNNVPRVVQGMLATVHSRCGLQSSG